MTVLSRTIRPLVLSVALIAPGAALVYTALHAPTVVTTTQRRDPVYAGMVGQWQGTVEERDDCDSTKRVTRATRVRVSAAPERDGLEMHVVTKDRADRVVTDTDHLQLNNDLTTAKFGGMGDTEMQVYDVRVADSLVKNSPLQFVMQREGIDAELWPETIRETVTIAPGEIRIVQERKNFGGEFEFRRAYRLRRVG